MVSPRRISDFKPILTRLAQTSHYQLKFDGLSYELKRYLEDRGVDRRFVAENSGLLCYSAVLPGSRLATADVVGNFMGVSEKMAHTRLFSQIQLDFYVDSEYKNLKFLEHWTEFISSGANESSRRSGYYYRMEYPDSYKCDRTQIVKFDRDYNEDNEIEYNFFGLFPIDLSSTPVKYEGSDVLKATATFSFDRYVSGKVDSYSEYRGVTNNVLVNSAQTALNTGNRSGSAINDSNSSSAKTGRRLIPINGSVSGRGGVVFYDSNIDSRNTAIINNRFFNAYGDAI